MIRQDRLHLQAAGHGQTRTPTSSQPLILPAVPPSPLPTPIFSHLFTFICPFPHI